MTELIPGTIEMLEVRSDGKAVSPTLAMYNLVSKKNHQRDLFVGNTDRQTDRIVCKIELPVALPPDLVSLP